MNTAEDINTFVSQKTLAMVGVSRNKNAFSAKTFHNLIKKGYKIYPVNPLAEKIGDVTCCPSLGKLPGKVGGVLLFTPSGETEKVVREAYNLGITNVWIQQGAESDAAISFCREKNISAMSGQCIHMFAPPVSSFHAFHRWFWKLFGKLPK